MRCRKAVREIDAMLDGRLDTRRLEELRTHLNGCTACRSLAASLQAAHVLLREELRDMPPAPTHLHGRIMDAVARERARKHVVPLFRLRPVMAAAAALLLFLSAWMLYHKAGDLPLPGGGQIAGQGPGTEQITTIPPKQVTPPDDTTIPQQRYPVVAPASGTQTEKRPTVTAVSSRPKNATAHPVPATRETVLTGYEKAVAADPSSAEARFLLAEAYWHVGEYAKALAHYHRAVDLNPADAIAYRYLAVAYQRLGMTDEAVQAYKQGIARTGDVQLMVNLGKIQERNGELATAVDTYADAAVAVSAVYMN